MSTVNEMKPTVGKEGVLCQDGLQFEVVILDARFVYGRKQFLIKPIAGEGQRWVDEGSIGGLQ